MARALAWGESMALRRKPYTETERSGVEVGMARALAWGESMALRRKPYTGVQSNGQDDNSPTICYNNSKSRGDTWRKKVPAGICVLRNM